MTQPRIITGLTMTSSGLNVTIAGGTAYVPDPPVDPTMPYSKVLLLQLPQTIAIPANTTGIIEWSGGVNRPTAPGIGVPIDNANAVNQGVHGYAVAYADSSGNDLSVASLPVMVAIDPTLYPSGAASVPLVLAALAQAPTGTAGWNVYRTTAPPDGSTPDDTY